MEGSETSCQAKEEPGGQRGCGYEAVSGTYSKGFLSGPSIGYSLVWCGAGLDPQNRVGVIHDKV